MRNMKRLVLIYICLAGDFQLVLNVGLKDPPTLGCRDSPRLVQKDTVSGEFEYEVPQNHTVIYYNETSEEMYVGGTGFVLKLGTDHFGIIENFSLRSTEQQQCIEGSCKNVITVIEMFQDSVFVCGTNGNKPQCWKLFPSGNNQSQLIVQSYDGVGISPFVHTQNSLSLTVEGDLYAAAPLDSDRHLLQFRRTAGTRTNVWMYDSWISEPTFISASWVKRVDDPDNEKIYIFFREKNSDNSPEADPWISRVGRVCKVDEGGSKTYFQNMWTSFLKARLVCGFPEDSLYFNRLQDIYVIHAEDWRNTRVYALFTSSWNSTAVCIYTIAMIDKIFETSKFKGYNNNIPNPRPGTCVKNSRTLQRDTLNVVKDHPEMTDWVYPMHHTAPFFISSYNYTKIVVDQVEAANKDVYNVLLLATDSGNIHKVLEAGSEPFIISETQLSNRSSIQSMKLDSKKKKLVVGFSENISIMDLQRCNFYNSSCADCVLARDPYCAWTKSGCVPTVPGATQNVMNGQITECPKEQETVKRPKRQIVSSPPAKKLDHSVPLGVPFYLSCPIDSYHAEYTWVLNNQSSPCMQMRSQCLLLIPEMAEENYGTYKCVSSEKNYTKVVMKYHLQKQKIIEKTSRNIVKLSENDASATASSIVLITLGLAFSGSVSAMLIQAGSIWHKGKFILTPAKLSVSKLENFISAVG